MCSERPDRRTLDPPLFDNQKYAVAFGRPRSDPGTAPFSGASGSLGCGSCRAPPTAARCREQSAKNIEPVEQQKEEADDEADEDVETLLQLPEIETEEESREE
jgi:hypothetical protein